MTQKKVNGVINILTTQLGIHDRGCSYKVSVCIKLLFLCTLKNYHYVIIHYNCKTHMMHYQKHFEIGRYQN